MKYSNKKISILMKFIVILLLVYIFLITEKYIINFTNKKSDGYLYLANVTSPLLGKPNKSGFINSNGEMVIKPHDFEYYYDTKAIKYHFMLSGCVYFILNNDIYKLDGSILVKDFHENEPSFSEGRFPVISEYFDCYSFHYNFIDLKGDIVFKNRNFSDASKYSEGLAFVIENGHKGYINLKGEMLIENDLATGDFHNGLAILEDGWFINRSGQRKFKSPYKETNDFHDGLALFKTEVNGKKKYGYINTNGKIVLKPIYCSAYDFSDGLAYVEDDLGYCFIDKNGKIIFRMGIYYYSRFKDGIALSASNGKAYNKKGKVIFSINRHFISFDSYSFYHNLLPVTFNFFNKIYKSGYINKQGDIVWGDSWLVYILKLIQHFQKGRYGHVIGVILTTILYGLAIYKVVRYPQKKV